MALHIEIRLEHKLRREQEHNHCSPRASTCAEHKVRVQHLFAERMNEYLIFPFFRDCLPSSPSLHISKSCIFPTRINAQSDSKPSLTPHPSLFWTTKTFIFPVLDTFYGLLHNSTNICVQVSAVQADMYLISTLHYNSLGASSRSFPPQSL